VSEAELWDVNAQWWQDKFTDGVDIEYRDQIEPLVAEHLDGVSSLLDIGAGEGQLSRVGVRAGVKFAVALEPVVEQVGVGVKRGGGVTFTQGMATDLPFRDSSFDAVLACLVFEHIDRTSQAIAEVSRVLKPGGRFLFLMNHPLLQTPGSGFVDDTILDEQYWRVGPYLVEDKTYEEVDRGVFLPFVHRPLSTYVNAMADVGLYVTRMIEPAPPPEFIANAGEPQSVAAQIPRLLFLRAHKN